MPETILFVFEGEKTERNILNSLKQFFLNDTGCSHIYATFNTDIYQLYKEIKADEFNEYLDIVGVLKNRTCNHDSLKSVTVQNVSQVYLFFDYDGHANKASDDKITELLDHFNEETENGKLFISYPMVEALKHLNCNTNFMGVCVNAKVNINYKKLVHTLADPHLRAYAQLTYENWKHIISEHCKKANYLIYGSFDMPEQYFSQEEVFVNQLIKHIKTKEQVAVLSAFPLFIIDYYGTDKTKKLIMQK